MTEIVRTALPTVGKKNPCPCGMSGDDDKTLNLDVGWDINVNGEERQHIETCNKCKRWRFVGDFYPFDLSEQAKRYYDKQWIERNASPYGE